MPEWYRRSIHEVLAHLRATRDGLSQEEADARLAADGPNRIEPAPETPGALRFLNQFRSPLILLLLLAAVGLAFIPAPAGEDGHSVDAGIILLVVLVNAVIGFVQENRARHALAHLRNEVPGVARVLRAGEYVEIPAERLVAGDIVVLDAGDKVPADIRLTEADQLTVREDALTGENREAPKAVRDYARDVLLPHRENMLHLGGLLLQGHAEGIFVGTGRGTELGRISHMVQRKQPPRGLQVRLDQLSRQIGIYAGLVCLVVFLVLLTLQVAEGPSPSDPAVAAPLVFAAVALAVAVIPEGLPVVLLLSLSIAARAMAARAAVVTRFTAMETLGATTVICTDKTGTLTENEMVVRRIVVGREIFDVSGHGYSIEGAFLRRRAQFLAVDHPGLRQLLKTGWLCNSSWNYGGLHGGPPTDIALKVLAIKASLSPSEFARERRVEVVPFDSRRRMMAVIYESPSGATAYIKGAPGVLLAETRSWWHDGQVVPLTPRDRRRIKATNLRLARQGYRVLLLAYRPLEPGQRDAAHADRVARGSVFVGLVAMEDQLRPSARAAVSACRKARIRVVLLTGDQPATAAAVGKELGLVRSEREVLKAPELAGLDDTDLAERVRRLRVCARATDMDKVRIVAALQARGESVTMIGDGINDAPAMVVADTAVAVGSGTDVAREASHLVLLDNDFSTLVRAVSEGRKIHRNTRNFLRYQLSTNLAAVLLTIGALAVLGSPALLPLLPVQLLWTNLILDTGPALALSADRDDRGLLRAGPPRGRLISSRMLRDILLIGVTMGFGTLFFYFWTLAQAGALAPGMAVPPAMLARAQTVAFTGFAMFQIANAFNCGAGDQSLGVKGITSNPLLLATAGVAFLIQLLVVYFPPFQAVLGTVALGAEDWAVNGLVPNVIILEEIRKHFS